MTSRERVLAALNHEEPDRVPLILGVDHSTTIMQRTYRKLKAHLGVKAEERYLHGSWRELGSARIDEEILVRFGVDARGVWDRKPRAVEERNERRGPDDNYTDDFGVGQIVTGPDEWFPGIHPLTESTQEALDAFPWPDMDDPTRFTGVRERAAQLAEEGEYAIFGTPWLLFPFERAYQLQGMEVFLKNMARDPDFAKALLGKLTALFKRHLAHFLEALDGQADVIVLGDDLGMQSGPLIAPKMYRSLLKPLHADLIGFVKERADVKVWFHSDGDIWPFLDDLIEVGVDILNPIQKAGRMADFAELKRRYGDQLCFCGAIDTQDLLPNGTPEEVRREVRDVMRTMGPGGGFMVSSVHTIMNDVPVENVLAMVEAVREYGAY
jgi:uroporphyrinogen decarboxylase